MVYLFCTLTVPAEHKDLCNELSLAVSGESGRNVWTTPFSPTGEAPATHYIASGAVGEDVVHYLVDPVALAEATGMTQANAEALLAACDVIRLGTNTAPEGEPPNAETVSQTLERLGLTLVQAPLAMP